MGTFGLLIFKCNECQYLEWVLPVSDIGGFAEQPSAELYARWIQLGVFPFCRTHSGHHGEQEPWSLDQKWLKSPKNSLRLDTGITLLYTCFGNIRKRRNSNVKTTSLL
jgi:hypothetical protein